MSTQTAPYDTAMRLGSGFNSYTQQLCINDAVVKDNKRSATEEDLRVVANDKGKISQLVQWTAKFVDTSSEVTDAMNISGSLEIKTGSIGAKGSGAYISTDKMKTSDINYFIQVKVVNQHLVADDVTKFNAIANAPSGKFTDIYGDSFISGYLEGGEFNALLSVAIEDSSKIKEIKAEIEVNLEKGGVGVKANAKGGIDKSDIAKSSKTAITVSWSGGGEIRDSKDTEWTIESLKRAALGFPDKVAKCPQRTHAILTKYTALRTYQELSNKGTPLDYENAGVYTSALLDAYMDYKAIWKLIQLASYNVNANTNELKTRSEGEELMAYGKEVENNFKKQQEAYKRLQDHEVSKDATALVKRGSLQEEPLAPNSLKPYAPSLIGLEQARRDCRWEMIKIVKEVDAVTNDPQVATDPTRIWQYLSPVIFRQLIPTVVEIPPPPTREDMAAEQRKNQGLSKELNDTKESLAKSQESESAKQKDLELKEKDLKDAHAKIEVLTGLPSQPTQQELLSEREKSVSLTKELDLIKGSLSDSQKALVTKQQELEAGEKEFKAAQAELETKSQLLKAAEDGWKAVSSGVVEGTSHGLKSANYQRIDTVVKFDNPGKVIPQMIYGLSLLNIQSGDIDVSCSINGVTNQGFVLTQETGSCQPQDFNVSWMALPSDIHFEVGFCDTWMMKRQPESSFREKVAFGSPFKNRPRVLCFFQGIRTIGSTRRLTADSENVTAEHFEMYIHCPEDVDDDDNDNDSDKKFIGARVGWVAYDDDLSSQNRIISGGIRRHRSERENFCIFFDPFEKDAGNPSALVAMSRVNFCDDDMVHASAEVKEVGSNGIILKDAERGDLQYDWDVYCEYILVH